MFFQDEDSGKTKWSLRSNPPYDVSVIARSFGGGGHLTAAGFEVTHTRGEDV
jgi:nanoRNase/pAp phosphatase (c-di-AMP/oligoRNAs hydrolase)